MFGCMLRCVFAYRTCTECGWLCESYECVLLFVFYFIRNRNWLQGAEVLAYVQELLGICACDISRKVNTSFDANLVVTHQVLHHKTAAAACKYVCLPCSETIPSILFDTIVTCSRDNATTRIQPQ